MNVLNMNDKKCYVFFSATELAQYYNCDISCIDTDTIMIDDNTYTPVAYIESVYDCCIYGVVYKYNCTYIIYQYGAKTDMQVSFDELLDNLNDDVYFN